MRDTVQEAFKILQENSPVFNNLPICEQEDAATSYAATAEACGADVKEYSDLPDAE
jgi:hypothetical protein